VEAIPSFDESRQRRSGYRSSGGTARSLQIRRFTHRNASVTPNNLNVRIPGRITGNRKL
jgi:hypothetical protein